MKLKLFTILFLCLFGMGELFAQGGFAASQARLLMLTARKTDLELNLQMIQQQRMYWADVASRLMMSTERAEAEQHVLAYTIEANEVAIQIDQTEIEIIGVEKEIAQYLEENEL